MDEKFIGEYKVEDKEEKDSSCKTNVAVLIPLECAANHYYYTK